MSAATPHGQAPYYFVPAPSHFPVQASFGLLLVAFGASQWINGAGWGAWMLLVGMTVWLAVLSQWFRQAIAESSCASSTTRCPNAQVRSAAARSTTDIAAPVEANWSASMSTDTPGARSPRIRQSVSPGSPPACSDRCAACWR